MRAMRRMPARATRSSAAQFSSSPDDVPSSLMADINSDPNFPKGQDFAQWLVNVQSVDRARVTRHFLG